MFTKDHIIAEIKRTAKANGGKALGHKRFGNETGIKQSDWIGKFWPRWGDAVAEAGFVPNSLQGPRIDDELLECLASFTRELGRYPVAYELKLRARTIPGFPWHNTLAKFGRKHAVVARLREFALANGYQDVVTICDETITQRNSNPQADDFITSEPKSSVGYVYLLKSGRFYKVGRSNAVGRRERELAIQLPERAEVIHSIKTDDPVGIEDYWHRRFADRRKNGEWFELSATDVAAFKRRKFM